MRGEVNNAPLREAFERGGLSKAEVARRMGLFRTVADVYRLNRMLGLEPNPRNGKIQQTVSYDNAVKIADTVDALYVEAGV